ncbi:MAG TPA: formyltransferase family protein [Pirellulaceae bacterium]|nr:formyltransferase family protein [Pirellulaceae bacterium]
MRIVALSTCDSLSSYVLSEVARAVGRLDVIQVEMNWQVKHSRRGGLASLASLPGRAIRSIERRLYRAPRERREALRLAELLANEHEIPRTAAPAPVAVLRSDELTSGSATACETLARLAPDLLLVHRAPLLPRTIYALARLGAWNLHYGLAPEYRGEGGLFWPLYFGELDRVGVTLHEIDDGVDTGRTIERRRLPVAPDDDEVTLTATAARAAATMIVDNVLLLQSRLEEKLEKKSEACSNEAAPAVRSRYFRQRDRRIWHDLICWLRRPGGRAS